MLQTTSQRLDRLLVADCMHHGIVDCDPGAALTEVAAAATLRAAMQLMTEHGVTHLLVCDHASGHPIGVLSTSDVVCAVGVDLAPGD